MVQQSLFDHEPIPHHPRVVNVASIPQLSPFRYPGGKTWLVPWVRQWLAKKPIKPTRLVEPFAGGGIIGLTAAFERLAEHVVLVELDPDVASVWKTILSDNAECLAQRILNFPICLDSVKETLSNPPETTQDQAFHTLLRNRVCHGGILAPGSGFIKVGENGKGIASRWYPETLARRIRKIHSMRHRLTFIQGDGLEIIRQYAQVNNTVFFIDPPYTAPGKRAGRRLYSFNEISHEALFDLAGTIKEDFMMTYDNADSVREMAIHRSLTVDEVAMKNTHHAQMIELLIGPSQHIL